MGSVFSQIFKIFLLIIHLNQNKHLKISTSTPKYIIIILPILLKRILHTIKIVCLNLRHQNLFKIHILTVKIMIIFQLKCLKCLREREIRIIYYRASLRNGKNNYHKNNINFESNCYNILIHIIIELFLNY